MTLAALRQSGLCLLADGSVLEKQFVASNMISDEGAVGQVLGFSVYASSNGDTVHAQFHGGWGAEGFSGEYKILGGSGAYANASGDGSIAGMQSPWDATGIYKITLNVTTP